MTRENELPNALVAGLGVQLGIFAQLYTALLERLVEPHGLTYPQFALLMHLARRSQPARVSDMAASVQLTQSAVTKAVQKFTRMGLVTIQRDSTDQRNRLVGATEAGRDRVADIQSQFEPAFRAMLQGWKMDDIARLTGDMARLSGWLDAERRD